MIERQQILAGRRSTSSGSPGRFLFAAEINWNNQTKRTRPADYRILRDFRRFFSSSGRFNPHSPRKNRGFLGDVVPKILKSEWCAASHTQSFYFFPHDLNLLSMVAHDDEIYPQMHRQNAEYAEKQDKNPINCVIQFIVRFTILLRKYKLYGVEYNYTL